MVKLFALFILISANPARGQEWKNLKSYHKETGNSTLCDGCWLKKDRKKKTETWKLANKFNLKTENGYLKYKSIGEIRDFYLWFDRQAEQQGHEIHWFGVTAMVEKEFSKLDSWVVRTFIIRNKEVLYFAREGSLRAFEYSFPQMRNIYFSQELIKGKEAQEWDVNHGTGEQCKILEPLYNKLSPEAFRKLDRIARRKGIYSLGIPKAVEYEGKLDDCRARVEYALKKLIPYYQKKKKGAFVLSR